MCIQNVLKTCPNCGRINKRPKLKVCSCGIDLREVKTKLKCSKSYHSEGRQRRRNHVVINGCR